jgi:D-alanyl-D-alanine dipeptidase
VPAIAFLLLAATPLATPRSDPEPLVDLATIRPALQFDIRYATSGNFLGRPLYPQARAFLRGRVAEALVRAHRSLVPQGLGLLVFDAYRPWSVTKLMWELTPPAKRGFVARPERGSNHNRGCAVDASLFVLATGHEVEMPSDYDEMTPRAAAAYAGGTVEERLHRDRLRAVLASEGFLGERHEWWHFNHRTCRDYPILDVPFEALPGQSAEIR